MRVGGARASLRVDGIVTDDPERWPHFWIGYHTREEGQRMCDVRQKVYEGEYSDSLEVVSQQDYTDKRWFDVDPVFDASRRPACGDLP